MTEHIIPIRFDEIREIAQSGVRRAATFMGLGVNAAIDPAFRSYQLTKLANVQIVHGLTQNRIRRAKAEFRFWIEGAGFRELTETFAIFLEAVIYCCSLIAMGDNGVVTEAIDLQKRQVDFGKLSVPDKLRKLRTKFGIVTANEASLLNLNKARNCLAHRRGRVGIEDLDDDSSMTVSWLGLEGDKQIPRSQSTLPVIVVLRSRIFELNQMMRLSTNDLAEICWFYDNEALILCKEAIAFARRRGFEVAEPMANSACAPASSLLWNARGP